MNITESSTDYISVTPTTTDFHSNFENTGVFARHEFLQSKPWAAFPTIVILSLASFVGTMGNVLTLLAIALNKSVRNVESVFIVNLALSDLYVTTVADPMSITAKLEGEHFFDRIPRLCQVLAKLCTISCVTSLLTIALMSINRYIYVCHNRFYKRIFSKRHTIVMCMSLYCVGLVLVLLNQAGIGDHGFDRKSLDCIWDRMATYPYTVVYSTMLVWIPCFVIGICYLRLYFFVRTHKKKISNHLKRNDANSPGPELPPRPKLQLAKTFILIYAAFVTCWAPYALLIVVDYEDTFLHEIHVYFTVWAHMHPSINWLIYYVTQRKMARAYHQILGCISQNSKQIRQSPNRDGNSSDERNKSCNNGRLSQREPQVIKDDDNMEWKPVDRDVTNMSVNSKGKVSNNNVDIYRKLYDEIRTIHSEGEVQSYVQNDIIKRESCEKLRASQSIGDLTKLGNELSYNKKVVVIRSVSGSGIRDALYGKISPTRVIENNVCDPRSVVISEVLTDKSENECETCTPQTSGIILRIPCETGVKEQKCIEESKEPQPKATTSRSEDANETENEHNDAESDSDNASSESPSRNVSKDDNR